MYQNSASHNAVFDSPSWRASWTFQTGGRIGGGLSIVGQTLYVESFDKNVYALDALTGRVLWKAALPNIAMNTPLVVNGKVYVGTGNNNILVDNYSSYVSGIPGGDAIYALDERTGQIIWRFTTVGEDMPTGAIANSELFLFSNGDGHVRALKASSGALAWEHPMSGSAAMGSIALTDQLAFGTSGTFARFLEAGWTDPYLMSHRSFTWALRPSDGQFAWISPYGSQDCSPTVGAGLVLVENIQREPGTPHDSYSGVYSQIDALDIATGLPRWEYHGPAGTFSAEGSMENSIAADYDGSRFYESLPLNNRFAAFDPGSSKPVWTVVTTGAVKMSAVSHGGIVYFGDNAGYFYSVRAGDGTVLAKKQFPGIFTTAPPIIVGSTIFLAAGNAVYAVPLDSFATNQSPYLGAKA